MKILLLMIGLLVAALPATAQDLSGTFCEFGTVEPCTRNDDDPTDKPWRMPWVIPSESPDYYLNVAPAPPLTAKLFILVDYPAWAERELAWVQDVWTRVVVPGESFRSEVPMRMGRRATVTHCYYQTDNTPIWCSTGPEVLISITGDAFGYNPVSGGGEKIALDGVVGIPDFTAFQNNFGKWVYRVPEDPDYQECLDPNPPSICQ